MMRSFLYDKAEKLSQSRSWAMTYPKLKAFCAEIELLHDLTFELGNEIVVAHHALRECRTNVKALNNLRIFRVDMNTSLQQALDNNEFSQELRDTFAEKGVQLSENVNVLTTEEWKYLIIDLDCRKDYVIYKKNRKRGEYAIPYLEVYQLPVLETLEFIHNNIGSELREPILHEFNEYFALRKNCFNIYYKKLKPKLSEENLNNFAEFLVTGAMRYIWRSNDDEESIKKIIKYYWEDGKTLYEILYGQDGQGDAEIDLLLKHVTGIVRYYFPGKESLTDFKTSDDPDGIAKGVFMKVLDKLEFFGFRSKLKTYVHSITINECKMISRKIHSSHVIESLDQPIDDDDYRNLGETIEDKKAINPMSYLIDQEILSCCRNVVLECLKELRDREKNGFPILKCRSAEELNNMVDDLIPILAKRLYDK